ncbi:MAG: DUF2807 domain-containing protein [Cyclobacteriaceae bacterium]
MRKSSLFILALLASAILFAQSETRDLDSFTKVAVGESIDVILKKGNKESAKVVVDDIDLEEVMTEVVGDKLKIYLEGNSYRNVDVQVTVTYVSLDGLKSSSSSSIEGTELIVASGAFDIACSSSGNIEAAIKAESIDIDVSSSGDVDLEVEADEIEIEVSSSGDIDISGKTNTIEVSASSSGSVDGYGLKCGDADLRASSSGSIRLTVDGELEARASSGGSIRYEGSPTRTDADTSSGGSVRKS